MCVSNEHRIQGLPVRFVRNTIMKGDRSDRGIICRISNEITVSYVLTDRTKNAIRFALSVTEGNATVESNPANSTRKRVLFNCFIYVNNGIAIKYSLREHSH